MIACDEVHGRWVFTRRVRVLGAALGRALQQVGPASVLDVGCGDGQITALAAAHIPHAEVRGTDVFKRPKTHVPVEVFDGVRLPYPDGAFEAVTAVDVLHHTASPAALLAEMVRVARSWVLLKDHFRDGFLAEETLRFMDSVGNRRHGVALPYCYLSEEEWERHYRELGLHVHSRDKVTDLYPWPVSVFFGRGLHFLDVLAKAPEAAKLRSAAAGSVNQNR
jgi:SAM-dependent methyltransferase